MRILLVDDEPELLNVLKKYFHGRGDDVVLASNGEQAWGVIQAASQPFDTLLTDHRMPVMSGIELIKKLRQHGYTLPIVMMSGDGEAHQDKATLKEIVELIAKPMRLSALERVFSTIEANLLTQPPEQTTEQSGSDSPEPNAIAKPDGPASSIDGLANQPTARILVVDDEPEIRTLLCKVLQSEAYHTDQAGDGIEALAKWRSAQLERPFDLLVVDLKMPRMDGATLLAQIRETDPIIPMIVLTGHADLNDSYDLLRKHHISDFLNKPLSHI
ncbi:MAG: CheY-like chemotaxis protein, partial [Phenylobacterium sp.]